MVGQIDNFYIRIRPSRLWNRLLSYALLEGRPLTTRGRWTNSLLFAHFSLEMRLPQFKRVKAPIFILGTGRRRTTILGIVLSIHRDVGFLNELKAMWHALRKDEDLIGSYTRIPARYRLDADDADPSLISAAHRLYGLCLQKKYSNDDIRETYEDICHSLRQATGWSPSITLEEGVADTSKCVQGQRQ